MQALGLDRFAERMGLLNILPEKLRRMHRLLPPLPKSPSRRYRSVCRRSDRSGPEWPFTGCVADAIFHHVNWGDGGVACCSTTAAK